VSTPIPSPPGPLPVPSTPLTTPRSVIPQGLAGGSNHGWNHLMRSVSTTLPTRLKQAQAFRRAALRSLK
jgi:hypothetical protein